ncbi:MAG TPA: RNA polymerase factor sigma-54 [Terriglobales bacterium]|nr:RNA polymerase factor sigma-54 [Terriglobales bacterium]
MVLLQHKLSLKVSQRQILTPGLVQMVSVLALNKLELRDMITAEMVENPVLEELEESVPLIDDVDRQEENRDRAPTEESPTAAADAEKKDPFEEIDFGSFFQDYLDPGYRSSREMEDIERPSFENFLSKPATLTDHLVWQLGSISTRPEVQEAIELIIGNLNEDGYLIASDEELLGVAPPAPPESDAAVVQSVFKEAAALGLSASELSSSKLSASDQSSTELASSELDSSGPASPESGLTESGLTESGLTESASTDLALAGIDSSESEIVVASDFPEASAWSEESQALELTGSTVATAPEPTAAQPASAPAPTPAPRPIFPTSFSLSDLHEAIEVVRQLDPPGVACRDLRECLLYQLRYHQRQLELHKNGNGDSAAQTLTDAIAIVDQHLRAVQNKQYKEIARALARPVEAVQQALDYVRTLDPRPGLRYNKTQPRLIEPDVAFVKHGDEWLVVMNDEDVPQLRLNPAYKRLLTKDTNDKDTRNYVKERYKSAIQLIKNIEQRKHTIVKVCYSILARQQDFLEKGIDQLKPMMIKEVAEEIGVHPSTVSRAVASKYAHTPQGVFELRYFFSESVNGPQGGNTSLLILKRRVKKLIEEEDPARPLTDEQITRILQSQGIQVTRRTVAKYREDLRIPSTHQRRVKK